MTSFWPAYDAMAVTMLTVVCDRDSERKRRVRELLGQLAQQEGDCKALKRQRK